MIKSISFLLDISLVFLTVLPGAFEVIRKVVNVPFEERSKSQTDLFED